MSEIEVNQIPKMLLNIHLMDLYNYFQNYERYKICQKQKEKNDSEKSIGNTNTQALIIRQNEKIAGLEKRICSILEHNMCLEKNKDHAEEVYTEAKKVLFKKCNIILNDEDVTDFFRILILFMFHCIENYHDDADQLQMK
ncbi:hypothetical protein RhiirC2_778945 [Rhizophagus irregularis]|uniref:Uncharacterized protein n=1 Tax=Rhizophagus irregularis TaxID=588596 RepID=A0A2N1NB03_9GLOM|nr:hypothetical protein RhiirC2_778945 [Rhizophagus irregularis]